MHCGWLYSPLSSYQEAYDRKKRPYRSVCLLRWGRCQSISNEVSNRQRSWNGRNVFETTCKPRVSHEFYCSSAQIRYSRPGCLVRLHTQSSRECRAGDISGSALALSEVKTRDCIFDYWVVAFRRQWWWQRWQHWTALCVGQPPLSGPNRLVCDQTPLLLYCCCAMIFIRLLCHGHQPHR